MKQNHVTPSFCSVNFSLLSRTSRTHPVDLKFVVLMSEVHSAAAQPNNTVDVSINSTELLASLIRFMRPVIEAITPLGNSRGAQAEQDAEAVNMSHSVEGQELAKSLEKFIGFVVKTRGKATMTNTEQVPESHLRENLHVVEEQSALPSYAIDMVRDVIFNELPIRLLAFDSDGLNIRLIDRNTMVNLVVKRLQEILHGMRSIRKSDIDGLRPSIRRCSRYAILSHTWIRELPGEILFQDWGARLLPENVRGYSKLAKFCQVAARDHGIRFGWMDTACINKESSTELDESIRSMFKWYQNADICITYLSGTTETDQMHKDSWFSRGWTLQELLANQNIQFYNQDWEILLSSSGTTLSFDDPTFAVDDQSIRSLTPTIPLEIQRQIFRASSITPHELVKFYYGDTHKIPLCRIMALAARRKVTRQEDEIYSLMGLLQVQIPIAYGEGSGSALQRMFRELMMSKHNFLDLFNHTRLGGLVPSTIQDYINHSPAAQNKLAPKHPVVFSHLGIHATLLAVPVFFQTSFNSNVIPSEIVRNIISWDMELYNETYPIRYVVLDNSSKSADWISNLLITRQLPIPEILYMGIFSSNIDKERDVYQLSAGISLGVPILPEIQMGNDISHIKDIKLSDKRLVTESEHKYWWRYGPKVIDLPYSGPSVTDNVFRFNGAEAEKLGIKVVSAYFR